MLGRFILLLIYCSHRYFGGPSLPLIALSRGVVLFILVSFLCFGQPATGLLETIALHASTGEMLLLPLPVHSFSLAYLDFSQWPTLLKMHSEIENAVLLWRTLFIVSDFSWRWLTFWFLSFVFLAKLLLTFSSDYITVVTYFCLRWVCVTWIFVYWRVYGVFAYTYFDWVMDQIWLTLFHNRRVVVTASGCSVSHFPWLADDMGSESYT